MRAQPDGYTLLLVSAANAISATLYNNLNFIFLRDIAPIAGIVRVPNVMEVNPSVPARTIPEFIAYAKANPGKINMAGVNGTTLQLAGELFKMMAGVDMVHVPYKGAGPALTDLLGGQVQVLFDNLSSSIAHIRAGKLRALAVTTATRAKALPDIPTVGEFVPGYEASAWQGIGAPKNTPAEIINKLNIEINAALADPKFRARLSDLGGEALEWLAHRLRETRCRRNREVGQGGEVLGRESRTDRSKCGGYLRLVTFLHSSRSPSCSTALSARTSTDCGIVSASAFAVFIVISSSNSVGCSIGRSPVFVPLSILST